MERSATGPYDAEMKAVSGKGVSLSMLGWAWNEAENVGDYIERAEKLLRTLTDDFELVLIDDGSTDGTAEIVWRHQQARPWVRP